MLANNQSVHVLIAGKSHCGVDRVANTISEIGDYKTSRHVMTNGCHDPFVRITDQPSILVLLLEPGSTRELEILALRSPSEHIPFVVLGDQLEPHILRSAMQAGARDFLSPGSDKQLIGDALKRLNQEIGLKQTQTSGRKIAIVNAAGGNGATTIAVNLAYQFANASNLDTVLIDLDFDYAPICQYLDLVPKRSMLEAMARAEELDVAAVDGYLTTHSSGIKTLSAYPGESITAEDLNANFKTLLDLVSTNHERVVIDIPNQLNAASLQVLDQSDDILIVMQQNLVSIRNAKHLIKRLQTDLGIRESDFTLVVNRFDKNATLGLADIKRAVKDGPMFTVPNQFKAVAESIETGMPLMHTSAKSGVGKAIADLEKQLGGATDNQSASFLTKTLSSLFRS